MNRSSLIECVDRHLQRLESSYGTLPLGEVVPPIAAEIRRGVNTQGIPVNIIPLQVVSAFVDGNATDEEARAVCQAVLVDNSVLAEVIAAVRAADRSPESLPPLETAFADRLLAMVPTPQDHSKHPFPETIPDRNLHLVLDPRGAPTAKPENDGMTAMMAPAAIMQEPLVKPARYSLVAAIVLALAASVFLFAWLNSDRKRPSGLPEVVDNNGIDSNDLVQTHDLPVIDNEPLIATDVPLQITQSPDISPQPKADVSPNPPSAAEKPPMELAVQPAEIPVRNGPLQLVDIHWTRISGLLARRRISSGIRSPGELPSWSGVEAGSHDLESDQAESGLYLVSLPGSRAESEIASGGKLILSSDTGLSIDRSGQKESTMGLNLEHGAFALVDLPARSVVDLVYNDVSVGKVVWASQASMAVASTAAGLQVQITGGDIAIGDQVRRDVTLLLNQDHSIQEISDRSQRLPPWVLRSTENVPMPRSVLAQLAGADNLGLALDRMVALYAKSNLPVDVARLEIMAGWRASLADEQLVQLASSDIPAMRQAAFQRLVLLPEWDGRAAKIWRRMESTLGDANSVVQARAMLEFARRGAQPTADQVDHLVAGLDSPEIARRALSDFLLRRFFGGGPVFDPTWTGQAHVRGVGFWRRYINATRPISAARVNP